MKKASFLNSNLSFKENSCWSKVTNNVIKYYRNKLGITTFGETTKVHSKVILQKE